MTKNNNNILMIILIIVLVLVFFGGYRVMNLFGGHYSGYYGFGGLFGVIAVLAAIWVIYDVIVKNKGLSDAMKVLWIICAVLFSIITAIVYYFIGRDAKSDLFSGKKKLFK